MFKKNDPNSYTEYIPLFNGTPVLSPESNQIGYLVVEYQVVSYDNVQVQNTDSWKLQSSNLRQFMLHCTQRIVIYNPNFSPSTYNAAIQAYIEYPAMINTYITVSATNASNNAVTVQVLDYSPKTVNSKVQSSGSTGIGSNTGQSSSISNTVGSSTSETNSYGTSVSVGGSDMGDFFSLNGSVTDSFDQSFTTTNDRSNSASADSSSGRSQNTSSGASMSIKDWGAYCFINPLNQYPNWIFLQEYPWDVAACNQPNLNENPNEPDAPISPSQQLLIIPENMANRLSEGSFLYPPSQLSMYGVNFAMKAVWLVSIDYSQPNADSNIKFDHNIFYSTASHCLNANKGVNVYIDSTPVQLQLNNPDTNNDISTELNLEVMALGVLGLANKPAITGFIPSKFIIQPSPTAKFKIISSANTLMIQDTTALVSDVTPGLFSASETTLTASFSEGSNSLPPYLQMTLFFKVADTLNDYTLYLKHWISDATDGTVMGLYITINGDSNNQIVKYVTAQEAEGGENNLLKIELRNQNFASVDYHDYLQLGLNSIVIGIQPTSYTPNQIKYQVRAISVEDK